ncbi:cupredoxin domain-containing protein [Verrucomicrobiota bacterium sgz303538]
MDSAEITVVVTGIVLIIATLWFFFGPRQATTAQASGTGLQEVTVHVKGGYSPNLIEVKQGRPVRLTFVRQEDSSCTEQVVLSEFGIVRDLPKGKPVPVEFTPEREGSFPFHCGMNMVRGTLVVKP